MNEAGVPRSGRRRRATGSCGCRPRVLASDFTPCGFTLRRFSPVAATRSFASLSVVVFGASSRYGSPVVSIRQAIIASFRAVATTDVTKRAPTSRAHFSSRSWGLGGWLPDRRGAVHCPVRPAAGMYGAICRSQRRLDHVRLDRTVPSGDPRSGLLLVGRGRSTDVPKAINPAAAIPMARR